MRGIKRILFSLFLVGLLIMPTMVGAMPVNNVSNSSFETVLLEDKDEHSKEYYQEEDARLCTICAALDIIMLILILLLVLRLFALRKEKAELLKKENE